MQQRPNEPDAMPADRELGLWAEYTEALSTAHPRRSRSEEQTGLIRVDGGDFGHGDAASV